MASPRALLPFGSLILITSLLSGCFFGGGRTAKINTNPAEPAVQPDSVTDFRGTGTGDRAFADGIAAIVNGRVVTKSEVRESVVQQRFLIARQEFNPKERDRKIREVERLGLSALIDRELKLEAYEEIGFPVKDRHVDERVNYVIRELYKGDRGQFLEDLRKSRPPITIRRFREQQLKNIKVQRMHAIITRDKVNPPTPNEIQSYYDKHRSDFREEGKTKVRTISIPKLTRDGLGTPKSQGLLASDILRKLRNGASFAEMAKTYSADPAREKGGDRGYVARGTLNPLLENAAFNLKEGEISEVIEGPTTYYILWAEKRQYGRAAPLDELRDEIELRITQQRKKELVDEWVASRRKRALIKIF